MFQWTAVWQPRYWRFLLWEAYRQRLSRIKKKMAGFLDEYCGLSGKGSVPAVNGFHAIATHRVNPEKPEYTSLEENTEFLQECKTAMEEIDDRSLVFSSLPAYRTTRQRDSIWMNF